MRNHVNKTMTHKNAMSRPFRDSSPKTKEMKTTSDKFRQRIRSRYSQLHKSDDNIVQTPEIHEMIQQGLAVIKPKSLLDRLLWESNKSYVLHDGGDRREYHSYPVAKNNWQKIQGLFTNKYRPEWTIQYFNGGGSSSGGGQGRK